MVGRILVVGFALVTIWTSSAFGQVQDAREIRARKDCLTGKFESGVALLAQLFAETGNRNFVYNQARCYEQNARADDAVNRFREYLRVAKGISAEDKADVERHIAECRLLQAEQDRKVTPPPSASPQLSALGTPGNDPGSPAVGAAIAPQVSAAPAHETPPVGENASMDREMLVRPLTHDNSGSAFRITGAAMGGVGIAALATGGIFSLLVKSTQDQVEADAGKRNYSSSLDSRGRSYETLQWVSYGVGAGLVLLGGAFYIVGHRAGARTESPSIALVPGLVNGKGSLALQGRF
jgi:hypothetical protein